MVEKFFKESIEVFFYSYVFTFGLAPAIIGYICARYTNLLIRCLFALWVTLTGYYLCKGSYHGFEIYLLGNVLYVFLCILGLHGRAKSKQKTFWSQYHFDWMLVSSATILLRIFYVRPLV